MKKKIGIILLFIALAVVTESCYFSKSQMQARKAQKEAYGKLEEKKEDRQQEYEEAVRKNWESQSKETQKMMKQTYKKAEKHNYNKKDPFFVRLGNKFFGPKKKTRKRKSTR